MKTRSVLVGMMLVSSFALAQPSTSPESNPRAQNIAQIQDQLGLTEEQAKKMREIRDNGGSMADMRAVLTPEQKKKAAQLRKEHEEDPMQLRGVFQQVLGLSDEQMSRLEQIRKDGGSRADMIAVLTPEQKEKFKAMSAQHGPN
jgi:Spy/CpxP family protein refolding chaperone